MIEDVCAAIGEKVQLPQGYFVQYGGQFESQEKASRQILLLSLVAIAGIFLLLLIALKSIRSAFLVMANLPLALIDGVVTSGRSHFNNWKIHNRMTALPSGSPAGDAGLQSISNAIFTGKREWACHWAREPE